MSVFNNSTEGVILGTVLFKLPGGRQIQIIVDQSIAPGAVIIVEVGKLVNEQTKSAQIKYFSPQFVGDVFRPSNYPAQDKAAIISDLDQSDYQKYTVEAINVEGADYRLFQSIANDIILVTCSISIYYQVVGGRTFTKDLPCAGLVRERILPAGSQ